MVTLELQGRITKKGHLEVKLPAGIPEGEVTVRIEVPGAESDWKDQPWTDAEIQEMVKSRRSSFKELVEWLNAHPSPEPWGGLSDDEDVGEYVHKMRRQTRFTLEEPGE